MKLRFLLFVLIAGCITFSKSAMSAPQMAGIDGSQQRLSAYAIFQNNNPNDRAMWYVHLATDGKLSVAVQGGKSCGYCSKTINYPSNSEHHASFRSAVNDSKFFQIDKVIGQVKPIPDRPVRILGVTLGAMQYQVELLDPKTVNKSEEVNRFFIAWDALLSKVPDELEGKNVR